MFNSSNADLTVAQKDAVLLILSAVDGEIGDELKQLGGVDKIVGTVVGFVQMPESPYFVVMGEDPRQAAARECREETGLEVNDLQLRDVIARQSEVEGADILIVFEGTVASGVPQPGDDAERASFFGPNELPDLAFPSTRMILSLWRNGTPPT